MYQRGEVVLLEYPYTDLIGVKLRPAIVLKDTNDDDIVLARATSQPKLTDYDVRIENWETAGLLKPSIIRVHKIMTLESKLIKRRMGILSATDMNSLSACLKRLFDF